MTKKIAGIDISERDKQIKQSQKEIIDQLKAIDKLNKTEAEDIKEKLKGGKK